MGETHSLFGNSTAKKSFSQLSLPNIALFWSGRRNLPIPRASIGKFSSGMVAITRSKQCRLQ